MNEVMQHSPNWADFFIVAVVFISTLISIMRGFISEAISLLTWVIAAVIAFKFAPSVSNLFTKLIHAPSLRLIISFIIVLIVILIIGSIINHFLTMVIKTNGLLGTNRLLGMIFGFARGVLLMAILILFARMTSVTKDTWWQSSILIPYFMGIANWLQQSIPIHLNHFPNLHPKG